MNLLPDKFDQLKASYNAILAKLPYLGITFLILFFIWLPKNMEITIKFGQPKEETKDTTISEDVSLGIIPTLASFKIPHPEVKVTTTVKDIEQEKMTDYEIAMWLLKSHESLRYQAYWDVKQWTIGWGTKSKEGEIITRKEADVRAQKEFSRVYDSIEKRYPHLDRWTKLILTVTDYNVGKFGASLEKAIKENNKDKIAKILKKYYHDANGRKLPGLVKRRNAEADLLLASDEEKQTIGKKLRERVINCIHKAEKHKP